MAEENANAGNEGSDEGSSYNGVALPEGFEVPAELKGVEKFYSVEEGEDGNPFFNWEATALKAAVSYKELQSKLGEKENSVRERLEGEVRAAILGTVPDSVEGYEAKKPELPEGVEIPDGFELADPEGPLTDAWKNFCYENKLGKELFDKGIQMYTAIEADGLKGISEFKKELGENADTRIGALDQRLKASLGEEALGSLIPILRSDSTVFQALETLMTKVVLSDAGGSAGDSASATKSNEDIRKRIDELMNDPRYLDGDDAIHSEVRKLYDGIRRAG